MIKHVVCVVTFCVFGATGFVNAQNLNSISGSGFNIVVGPELAIQKSNHFVGDLERLCRLFRSLYVHHRSRI